MKHLDNRLGLSAAMPLGVVLLLCFAAPLVVVAVFSVMPQKVFSLTHMPDFSAYKVLLFQGYYKSLLWSLGMAGLATVLLFLICWPLAYGMAKVFGRFTLVITILVVINLFVSENIRLFGWVLTLMKGGLIEGTFRAMTGLSFDTPLYNVPIVVFGLIYVYFPFMLFPLAQGISMVPDDARQAAADLGASRWRILREIDLPLAAPGIVVGGLLTFVLSAGAMAEAKLLGGRSVIVIADDIETAFTYGQNWPLGSALSMVLIVIIGSLAIFGVSRIDLDAIMGEKTLMNPSRTTRLALLIYGIATICFLYLPLISVGFASVSKARYLTFPIKRYTLDWYGRALESATVSELLLTSLKVALIVTLISMIVGFFGALAFARYQWRYRSLFQKLIMLPIFFPQAVLGLALLIWFNSVGITPTWKTAIIGHLVWIAPIATLIIAIRAYSFDPALEEAARDMGASTYTILREITFPLLLPGIISAGLFAFLLSWGNFPLSLFTTGVDATLPEWLYAKMVSGYSPLVPTVGVLSIIVSILLMLIGFIVVRGLRTARMGHSK